MKQNLNYQKLLDETINKIKNEKNVPKLLLHSCCAPCSSYVIEYLSDFFYITVFYYNPGIYPSEEYMQRLNEQKKLISQMPTKYKVKFMEGEYDHNKFLNISKDLENCKEGGERCTICYEMRLSETGLMAKNNGYDYFTTTLTVSPYKNAQKLNEIGEKISKEYGVNYLYSDFKKNEGYKRSIKLSKEYGLYRQNYCGCIFSKRYII